jgi:hypothetical protein
MFTNGFSILLYIFIGILLMLFAFGLFSSTGNKKKKHFIKETPRVAHGIPGSSGVCPVCGSVLYGKEQIKSVLYPGEKDRLCHIFGCQHCHPYKEKGIFRECPVCKKELPGEGYLVARLFDRENGKHHVHIIGCTGCRITGKKDSYHGR